METTQTAVDWLIEQMKNGNLESYHKKKGWNISHPANIINPLQIAKHMEQEQIRDAYFTASGYNTFDMPEEKINSAYNAAQEYYKKTYNK